MGGKQSVFTEEELQEYEDCTFFTKREILKIHKIFVELAGEQKYITKHDFINLPILRYNPFRERISKIFSSDTVDGKMSFDDFLDFLSVFSPDSTLDVKTFTVFKIYDFDDDGYISRSDIQQIVRGLVGKELMDSEIELVCDKVMSEVDIDGDGQLSYVEFDQILSRAPDFITQCRIRVL